MFCLLVMAKLTKATQTLSPPVKKLVAVTVAFFAFFLFLFADIKAVAFLLLPESLGPSPPWPRTKVSRRWPRRTTTPTTSALCRHAGGQVPGTVALIQPQWLCSSTSKIAAPGTELSSSACHAPSPFLKTIEQDQAQR